MPREWDNPTRNPWNAHIHQSLKAIDQHNQEYFKTGNIWHLQKAEMLRQYIKELKDWIISKEND